MPILKRGIGTLLVSFVLLACGGIRSEENYNFKMVSGAYSHVFSLPETNLGAPQKVEVSINGVIENPTRLLIDDEEVKTIHLATGKIDTTFSFESMSEDLTFYFLTKVAVDSIPSIYIIDGYGKITYKDLDTKTFNYIGTLDLLVSRKKLER